MSEEKNTFDDKKARDWLRGVLLFGNALIEFTKKDGTTRKMLCTLNENVIPRDKAPKNTGRAKNDEVLAVYDLDKQEWRSFRYDSITRIRAEV